MIEFFAGAVTMSFVIAGVFFLRFWKKTADQLFLYFAIAFWLLAANQLTAAWLGVTDERTPYVYLLRVLAFGLIIWAIIGKNVSAARK